MNNINFVNKQNINNISTQNVEVKEKRSISKSIYIDINTFLDLNDLISLLVRLNYKNIEQKGKEHFVQWKTLGEQIILKNLNSDTYVNEIENLQNTILQRLEYSMEKYKYREVDIVGIQLILYKCGFDVKIKKDPKLNKESFGVHKDLVNLSRLESVFYKLYPISDINNKFGVLLEKEVLDNIVIHITLLNGSKVDFQELVNGYSLEIKFSSNMNFYQKKVGDKDYILVVDTISDKELSVYIYGISGMKILHVVDKILDSENVSRTMGNVCFYINKTKGIYKKEILTKFSPIYANKISGRLSRLTHPDYKFGSLDLETYKLNDKSYVYAIGFYADGALNTFYLDESLDSDDLIFRCLNALLVDKYNGYTFYVHNLAGFDIYFILPTLNRLNKKYSNIFEYKNGIVFRDDEEIISIKISVKVKTEKSVKVISVKLVDSCKLLNSDLDSLCKTFGTDVKKSIFPYNFVKKQTLFYKGEKPSMEYYENIDVDFYNKIDQHNWSMINETLFYLNNDLISLYEVMDKFIKSIYINYHVHATSTLTISSLSMNIFLRRFYNNNIPLIKEKSIFNDLKDSYYGGITEVYKPYGTNLFYYDVNSLYPYSAINSMPGLNCVYVDNINRNINEIIDLFGFYYCEIECYEGYLGLLSVRADSGIIQPLGKFKGWYFSEELKFANEHGYKIHILKGYNFDKSENVFTEYFSELYKIKSHSKDNVERALAKSKLNNLIGKLGSNIEKYETKIVSEEEFLNILRTRKYRGVKYLDGEVLVTYDKELSKKICEQNDIDYKQALFDAVKNASANKNLYKEERYNNVSIALASAITAYSRIFINKAKIDVLKKGGSIYYSDTDSLVTDIKLDDSLVGSEMGKFKLEHEIVEGYFISNKTYSLKDKNGKIIFKNKGVFVNKENDNIITPFEDDKDHKSLAYEDFQKLYLGENIKTFRYESNKNISSGYVNIKVPSKVTLSTDSYTKRTKVFSEGLWVDTKPLILNNNDKQYHTLVESKNRDINNKYSFSIKRILDISHKFITLMLAIIVYILMKEDILNLFDFSGIQGIEINYDTNLDKLFELQYMDDYMEEPIEVEIYKEYSYFDKFINLFTENRYKPTNLYSDYVHIKDNFSEQITVKYSSTYTDSNIDLSKYGDRPQVLSNILKYHLDIAYQNINILNNKISDAEVLRVRKDIIIRDVLFMCNKALSGSPFIGGNSPFLGGYSPIIGQYSPFKWASPII